MGNRITIMVAPLPVDVKDPVERLAAVRAEMADLKDSKQAQGAALLTPDGELRPADGARAGLEARVLAPAVQPARHQRARAAVPGVPARAQGARGLPDRLPRADAHAGDRDHQLRRRGQHRPARRLRQRLATSTCSPARSTLPSASCSPRRGCSRPARPHRRRRPPRRRRGARRRRARRRSARPRRRRPRKPAARPRPGRRRGQRARPRPAPPSRRARAARAAPGRVAARAQPPAPPSRRPALRREVRRARRSPASAPAACSPPWTGTATRSCRSASPGRAAGCSRPTTPAALAFAARELPSVDGSGAAVMLPGDPTVGGLSR